MLAHCVDIEHDGPPVEHWPYIFGVAALAALVVIVVVVRRAKGNVEAHGKILGANLGVRKGEAEMTRIKAGRDVKAVGGQGDPARMSDIEAGRDVTRDTSGRDDPKA
jgi:hypothetical protein